MKEAFKEIIERLEEELEWSSTHGKDVKFREGRLSGLRTGMRIVKEVAEECKSLTVEQKSLTEKFNDGWIPCSERLPETDGKYIVCTTKGSVYCTKYHSRWKSFGTDMNTHIEAWQPLPAPYQPKGE